MADNSVLNVEVIKGKVGQQSEEDQFYAELGVEIDAQVLGVLKSEYKSIKNGEIEPSLWCQDMMLLQMIPQKKAADFLKTEHGIDVVLLPEPDISITILDPNPNDVKQAIKASSLAGVDICKLNPFNSGLIK